MRGIAGRRLAWILLAVAVALAGAGIRYATAGDPDATPSGPGLAAHLWVDPTGGDCDREPAPSGYVDGNACDSLDAANDNCISGDTVLVKGGVYPAQTLTGFNGRTGPGRCTIKAEPGAQVVVDGLASGTLGATDGSRFVTLEGFVLRRPRDGKEAQAFVGGGSRDVTLKDVDGSSFYVRDTTGTRIEGGDWGPCLFSIDIARDVCTVSKFDSYGTETNSRAVVDGANFHDYRNDQERCLPAPGTVDCHNECLFVRGVTGGGAPGKGITIRNSRFENCAYFAVFVQPGDQPVEDITIENNWFEPTWDDGPVTCCAFGRATAIMLSNSAANVLIRFNSFHEDSYVTESTGTALTNVRIVGNVMKGDQCLPAVTYDSNLFSGAPCGTNAASIRKPFPYADPSALNAGGDYHLSASADIAVDYVKPDTRDYRLAEDYDGDRRTPGARDAGADERSG